MSCPSTEAGKPAEACNFSSVCAIPPKGSRTDIIQCALSDRETKSLLDLFLKQDTGSEPAQVTEFSTDKTKQAIMQTRWAAVMLMGLLTHGPSNCPQSTYDTCFNSFVESYLSKAGFPVESMGPAIIQKYRYWIPAELWMNLHDTTSAKLLANMMVCRGTKEAGGAYDDLDCESFDRAFLSKYRKVEIITDSKSNHIKTISIAQSRCSVKIRVPGCLSDPTKIYDVSKIQDIDPCVEHLSGTGCIHQGGITIEIKTLPFIKESKNDCDSSYGIWTHIADKLELDKGQSIPDLHRDKYTLLDNCKQVQILKEGCIATFTSKVFLHYGRLPVDLGEVDVCGDAFGKHGHKEALPDAWKTKFQNFDLIAGIDISRILRCGLISKKERVTQEDYVPFIQYSYNPSLTNSTPLPTRKPHYSALINLGKKNRKLCRSLIRAYDTVMDKINVLNTHGEV